MISINLTTTYSRLDLCSATLWSLLHQSLLPERVNLWISNQPYMADEGITELPSWIKELNNIHDIIRIHYVENIGPYRKFIPALRTCTNDDIIVYVDDDVIYARNWFEGLLSTFEKYGRKYVVASRVREKKFNLLGKLQSYNMFNVCTHEKVLSSDFIITGVGGCVLMKKHINDAFLKLDDFKILIPKTDDIWISKIIELSNSEVMCASNQLKLIQEIEHSNNALNHTNNTMYNGVIFKKIYQKTSNKILGYFGRQLSNNDKAIKIVDAFFKSIIDK
ncbi:glycosyltransferase [Klebsiella pneumoniae]|uniref:glycosyltransferase n=1 Tax=Klebsiella quasipneumoniae TaxID=1463165 RepID=UPI000F89DE75|nr:glycosyltransferase [Klebsiella quasipneumoniae]AZR62455.1 glycosyltransferase [Klebsiella quasipneumoniae]HCI6293369.1 glycosyltransferase [Klebsiella quasipneumoniae subsp. similipneumoniae]HCM6593032.1 glycosyltransferase [Klebsiella quasipneumoniae]